MANTKSSKKDLRRSARKRAVNLSVRSGLKTQVKKARAALSAGEGAKAAIIDAVKALDKAVQRGIIHKNQAARRKSRIMKQAGTKAGSGTAVAEAAPKREAKLKKGVVKKKKAE